MKPPRPALVVLAVLVSFALSACDAAESEPESQVPPETFGVQILAPAPDATIRLGEPFPFRAEVVAGRAFGEVGIQLFWRPLPPGGRRAQVVYRMPVERGGAAEFVIDREVVIDALAGGDELSDFEGGSFSLGVYARSGTLEASSGVGVSVEE